VATWQQIITFKTKIDTIRKIENKGWFAWRLQTNERMITSIKVEFECWACSQHGEKHGENGKKHNNESTQQVTMPKLEWFWQH
jgi:hypothetical protein